MRSANPSTNADQWTAPASLTTGESSFRNAKLRQHGLVAYKAVADLAAKASLFVVTIVAARQLTARGFGAFALGSTFGWMLAVATDFGMQMHLARTVAQSPDNARHLFRRWG